MMQHHANLSHWEKWFKPPLLWKLLFFQLFCRVTTRWKTPAVSPSGALKVIIVSGAAFPSDASCGNNQPWKVAPINWRWLLFPEVRNYFHRLVYKKRKLPGAEEIAFYSTADAPLALWYIGWSRVRLTSTFDTYILPRLIFNVRYDFGTEGKRRQSALNYSKPGRPHLGTCSFAYGRQSGGYWKDRRELDKTELTSVTIPEWRCDTLSLCQIKSILQ